MFQSKKAISILFTLLLCFAISISSTNSGASAATGLNYPRSTITITVGFAAGGASDILSRTLAEQLSKQIGQPVIVVNRPGAGGSIAVTEVLNARPDGYNIAFGSNGSLLINPHVTDFNFMPEDFTPLTLLTEIPIGIAVNVDSQFMTMRDLIDYAKQNPGRIRYTSAGINSTPHLVFEAISIREGGIAWNHVPQVGTPQALADLMGGHIDVYVINIPSLLSGYQGGTIRVIATTSNERFEAMPDVPTLKEALGYDVPFTVWFGLVMHKDTPREIVEYLHYEIQKAMQNPTLIEQWENLQFPPLLMNLENFVEKCAADGYMYLAILREMDVID